MHPLRRRLPSLNPLFVIEAVGRHLSFTAAAAELGISQPAVSKAIKTAESGLGFELFERLHRGLRMTPKGAAFFRETHTALQRLHGVLEELSPPRDIPAVRASFSSSFVALWLLPRVPALAELHPGIRLHLEESDSDGLDLAADDLDFSARLGQGNWTDVRSTFLVEERIGAVASPAYLRRNPGLSDAPSLLGADLIHVDEPRRIRIGWRDWFARLSVTPPYPRASLTVSDYNSAIDAAVMGQGLALGWEHLVQGKIDQGALVWIGDARIATGMNIYLVEPVGRAEEPHLADFRSWILGEFAAGHLGPQAGPAPVARAWRPAQSAIIGR
jgi:LysR family glycine cleavage system transcriptional activator